VKKGKQIIMLYRIHLKSAQEWGNTWYTILDSTNLELEKKYKTIEMKLQTLVRKQIKQPENTNSFYHRVINKTDIECTNYELTLLNKGLKYNLYHKQKSWIKTLALEAETAITQLHLHMNKTIYQ